MRKRLIHSTSYFMSAICNNTYKQREYLTTSYELVTCIPCLRKERQYYFKKIPDRYDLSTIDVLTNRINFLKKQKEYNKSFEEILKNE